MKKIFYILILALSFSLSAQVRLYRKLPEFTLSPHFKVEIKQGSSAYQEIYTYQITPNATGHVTKNDQFANFGFNPAGGAVQIRVTRNDGQALTVSNSRMMNKTLADVTQSHSGGALILNCTSSKKHIYVSVDGKTEFPLMIFADDYADKVYPANAKVVTFAARNTAYVQNAQYDRYTVPNDVDVVVIEDGALIKGTIHVENNRSKPLLLTGRGVVLGNGEVLHGAANIPYNAVAIRKGNNHTIENIMVINSRHFTVDIGDGGTIDNVKMYGYDANNDGIVGGDDSEMKNVFSKVNDDHIKLYNNNMHVSNCNFWVQQNGALFQLAWNSIKPGSNCLVENCEVLAWEAKCGDPKLGQGGVARTFINLRGSDSNPVSSNNVFKNIYVQGQLDRFIGINGKYDGSASLTLNNYTLENITIEKKPTKYSWIYTGNSPSKVEFNFKNVKIAGQCLTAQNYQFNTEGNVVLNYLACGSNPVDTQAPSIPQNLIVSNTTQISSSVAWSASTDNVGVTGYQVFVDNVLQTTVSGTSVDLSNLVCATSYSIKVKAKDAAGNLSAFSSAAAFNTNACDLPLPADISDLQVVNVTCQSVKLKWTDVNNETAYRIRRKLPTDAVYTNIADVAAGITTYTDFTVDETTEYIYVVRPVVDNVAVANSNMVNVTTKACNVTGLENKESTSVKIYPNPSTDLVHFSEEINFTVLTVMGEELFSGTGSSVDLSHLSTGTYLIRYEQKVVRVLKL
jgi:hypothetical protein